MRSSCSAVALGVAAGWLAVSAARGASVSLSLVNPGSATVELGADVTLEVRATTDTRFSAVSYRLRAAGSAGLLMVGRSANPVAPGGLTYVSPTSQQPFDDDLPHDLIAAPILDVLVDNDFSDAPGGTTDGVGPGSSLLLGTITVRPTGAGSVVISLSDIGAVHTTTSVIGTQFESARVAGGSVRLTILDSRQTGDCDGDGDVDLADFLVFQNAFTGPEVLTANPCTDLDGDGDTDLADLIAFQAAFTGVR